MYNLFTKILALCALAVLLLNCSDKQEDKAAENKAKPLIVGTSADNPVYEFIENRELVGIDIDIIKAVGQVLGREVVIKNMDFTALFPSVSSGNVDLIIAALSVTPERKEHFTFSDVYLASSVGIIYKDAAIKNLNDFADKTVGVQLGTTWEGIVREVTKDFPACTVRALSNNIVLVEELKSGVVDGVALEDVQIAKFIEANPSLSLKKMVLPNFTSEFAIVTQLQSPLVHDINVALKTLRENGTLDKIKAKWLAQ